MALIYNIDFTKLIKWLVPPQLRNEFILNWLKALLTPVYYLYNQFTLYKADVSYRLSITPQVCYLRKILNDTFDKDLRRITIADTPETTILLIHTDDAQLPLYTYPEGSGNDALIPIIQLNESYAGVVDFIINIPFALSEAEEFRLLSIVNRYKLLSKKYKIIYS